MRCGRCGKNFDGEMYSGICPKCGHFNNRQTEYDVSKYFSAKFEEGDKTSTSAQAAKQHEQLHKSYDSYDMHKKGAVTSHEKLHDMYDRINMHKTQTGTSSAGYKQPRTVQNGTMAGKANIYQQTSGRANPYQQTSGQSAAQGRTFQAAQSGAYRQGNTYGQGQSGAYRPGSHRGLEQTAKLNGEPEKKNLVTPVCIMIALLAVIITAAAVQVKKNSLSEAYQTLDYEQQYAQAGELFEIGGRLLMVNKAEVVDTAGRYDLAVGEKLVAVTVEILPGDGWVRKDMSDTVYVSDGYNCKEYLDSYVISDFADDSDLLTGYDYLGYSTMEGTTGRFYFFVNADAEEITISFDEDEYEDTMYILQKRVSVSLQLEEEKS